MRPNERRARRRMIAGYAAAITLATVMLVPFLWMLSTALMDEFARSFHHADSVHMMDIYSASEKPIEGVSAEALARRIRDFGHRSAVYCGSMDRAVESALAEAKDGDLIVTLGAGNVWQAGDRLLDGLRRRT